MVANRPAKRAALIHTLINVIGALWALIFFPFIIKGIDNLMGLFNEASPQSNPTMVPLALSVFHTAFNVLNVVLLIGFSKQLVSLSKWIIPIRPDKELSRMKFIQSGIVSTSELSLFQAKQEICQLGQHASAMFTEMKQQLYETSDIGYADRSEKIIKMEDQMDKMAMDMVSYLTELAEKDISHDGSIRITAHLNIIDNIESVADCIYNINRAFDRKKSLKAWFSPELRESLDKMFSLVSESLAVMQNNLTSHSAKANFNKAQEVEEKINKLRNKLKKQHLKKMEKLKEYRVHAGIVYNDIFSECEKLGDYVFNVSESVREVGQIISE